MLNVVRVIPPNDDPKWPLWKYVQKVTKTGGGQGAMQTSYVGFVTVILVEATQE
jgi:hypothetical protein